MADWEIVRPSHRMLWIFYAYLKDFGRREDRLVELAFHLSGDFSSFRSSLEQDYYLVFGHHTNFELFAKIP